MDVSNRMTSSVAAFTLLFLAEVAHAACCDVDRTSTPATGTMVTICEMTDPGGCGAVLWEGELPQGSSANVCPATIGIRIDQTDPGGTPIEPTGAVCDGTDVEI